MILAPWLVSYLTACFGKVLGDTFRAVGGTGSFGGVYRGVTCRFCSIISDRISLAEAELVSIWEKFEVGFLGMDALEVWLEAYPVHHPD